MIASIAQKMTTVGSIGVTVSFQTPAKCLLNAGLSASMLPVANHNGMITL
jgi:hypothetical protein